MLRLINIRPVLNGFIVQVGCQELAFTDIGTLIGDLAEYLQDPAAAQKRLLPSFINRKHTHAHDPNFNHPPVPGTACDACAPMTATGERWAETVMPPRTPYPAPNEAITPGSTARAETPAPAPPQPRFGYGERVGKESGDYRFHGEVRAVFTKKSGLIRYAVENDDGAVHIFNESQLQLIPQQPLTA